MTNVTLTQHPVGQGGMMSGLLEIPGGRFHWVYDCGSNQTEALNREIAIVAECGPVDALFLSHLDKDHVHGVETLLGATEVREVVLPYLNRINQLHAAAHAAANGGLTGTFMALLADPIGWFQQRGVDRVTFMLPDDDDADEIGGIEPTGGGGAPDGKPTLKWSTPRQAPVGAPDSAIPIGSMVQCSAVDWVLLPYAHMPSKKKMLAFRKALHAAFGRGHWRKNFFAHVVSDRVERLKLRNCYNEIWRDHNLVSMALYAGPSSAGHGWKVDYSSWLHHHYLDHFADEAGWLGTGDMHLDVAVRRKRFIDFYGHVLDRVNVFGLPHHGSRHNFDRALLLALPNALQAVAASGPNSYGHPSPWVQDCVERTGKQFVRVNHRGKRTLTWRHVI